MLPWILLATAQTPDAGALRLLRRGEEFSIRLKDGNELMNSRLGGSEKVLAVAALERLAGRAAPHVLIAAGWAWASPCARRRRLHRPTRA